METVAPSVYQTTRCPIPENRNVNTVNSYTQAISHLMRRIVPPTKNAPQSHPVSEHRMVNCNISGLLNPLEYLANYRVRLKNLKRRMWREIRQVILQLPQSRSYQNQVTV
jgi:uncharacterized membrane protein